MGYSDQNNSCLLTPRKRVLLETQIFTNLVKNVFAFYGNGKCPVHTRPTLALFSKADESNPQNLFLHKYVSELTRYSYLTNKFLLHEWFA